MSVKMIAFENWIEKYFLDIYFEGNPFTEETYDKYDRKYMDIMSRHYPKRSCTLDTEFRYKLEDSCNIISDYEFSDFKNRFSYIKIEIGNIVVKKKLPENKNIIFARCTDESIVGHIKPKSNNSSNSNYGDIYDENDKLIAKYIGTLGSYYGNLGSGIFAGTVEELICQMPKYLKNNPFDSVINNKKYYYTCSNEKIKGRFCFDYINIHFYELVDSNS